MFRARCDILEISETPHRVEYRSVDSGEKTHDTLPTVLHPRLRSRATTVESNLRTLNLV